MLQPDLKTYVIEKINPDDYYRSRFSNYNPKTRANVTCCFHPMDRDPSLSINLRNGGARCFAASCNKSIGNIVHFEAEKLKLPEEEAAARLYDEFIRPIVPAATLEEYQEALVCSDKAGKVLARATGLNPSFIAIFKLGLDTRSKRFTFPITDRFGQCINVRFYRPKSTRSSNEIKIYSLVQGKGTDAERRYGNIELFPWDYFQRYTKDQPLFFMASEKETMLAIQIGLQAVCTTGGEGSWNDEWLEHFTDFDVRIVFDQDKGGTIGSDRLVATLQPIARSVFPIQLEFPDGYHGDRDFDDWIISASGNQFTIQRLASRPHQSNPIPSLSETRHSQYGPDLPRWYDKKLHEVSEIQNNPALLNRCIKTRGIVAAETSVVYSIPWKFKVRIRHGIKSVALPFGRELMSFVNGSNELVSAVLTSYLKTPVLEWEAKEQVTVQVVEIVPMVDISTDQEGRYTSQRCFLIGKRIESNTPFELTVVPITLPKSNEKIFTIVESVEVSRTVDTWIFKDKEISELEVFRPREGESVGAKLEDVANEIAANHSKIYSRTDLHVVAMLTWLCPVGFEFPRENDYQRGWINTLAIGDTQTGKSAVVATLQRLFKLGDIVNAENCTFVGLVGGAIKTGSGQMMLRWGRLPLCDRKLVVIEELSGLSVPEIARMSEVRSRGIARLDKGGLASQTPARTRLLALSNVRPIRKTLGGYLSGVRAIQELVGHPEDISRFDLIVTLTDSEVNSNLINSPPEDETVTATFTPDQLQRLCQFIWALKPNQVRLTDDAYIHCLESTQILEKIYHSSFPVFKAASGRLLITRIGAAIAASQFSWDGRYITIRKGHIDAAVDLMRNLYDKPSFGYLEYSRQMYDQEVIKITPELHRAIKKNIQSDLVSHVFQSLIHATKFSRDELAAIGSMQLFQADDLVGYFLRAHIIRKGEANIWEITRQGKDWMVKTITNYSGAGPNGREP
jgi:hypothetical protein